MRRPALYRPAPQTAWARPYPAGLFSPYFYNGDPTPAPPAGEAPAAETPKPKPPASPRPGTTEGELIVNREWLESKLTVEKDAGRRNGNQRLAADLGFDDVNGLRKFIEDQKAAAKAQLSETERLAQELKDREQQVAEREARAVAREHVANRRAVLVSLGAVGDDLDDATALLRVANDATDDDLAAAAEQLKARRPELFGARPAEPAAAPPAPTGLPSTGIPRPGASQPKPGERGLEMLRRRGKIRTDA
ncbi:hypothetical protein [Streptomyces sp. NPDC058657]|uniref:hypothetical protein n=1 Tax=unclassified Streptomyces TaxID=2593676 RepID=UPI00365F576A